VGLAREVAVDWVDRDGSRQAGFRGAYFSGSTVGLPRLWSAAEAILSSNPGISRAVADTR
jgi:hypothetical protein